MSADVSDIPSHFEDADGQGQLTIQEQIDNEELNQLMELKRRINDIRARGRVEFGNAGLSNDNANQIYLDNVQTLLFNLVTFASRDNPFWAGSDDAQPIGIVTIEPPPHPQRGGDGWQTASRRRGGVENVADSYDDLQTQVVYQMHGLLDVMRAPDTFSARFAFRGKSYSQRTVWVAERKRAVPREYIDRGVEWAFGYMSSLGIDLDTSKSERDVTADVV